MNKTTRYTLILTATLLLGGCGGGSTSSSTAVTTPPATTAILNDDLGTLEATNSDGSPHAFRWVASEGNVTGTLQSVSDWLAAHDNTSDLVLSHAYGVSDDGNTIVDQTSTNHAYLARVIPASTANPLGVRAGVISQNQSARAALAFQNSLLVLGTQSHLLDTSNVQMASRLTNKPCQSLDQQLTHLLSQKTCITLINTPQSPYQLGFNHRLHPKLHVGFRVSIKKENTTQQLYNLQFNNQSSIPEIAAQLEYTLDQNNRIHIGLKHIQNDYHINRLATVGTEKGKGNLDLQAQHYSFSISHNIPNWPVSIFGGIEHYNLTYGAYNEHLTSNNVFPLHIIAGNALINRAQVGLHAQIPLNKQLSLHLGAQYLPT